jgi:hypothetical protein
VKRILGAAGVALAAWLVWRLGPGRVWGQLIHGYWPAFAGVLLTHAVQQSFGTIALWLLGTEGGGPAWRHTPFARLTRVRYVGEVLNYALPTGAVGGEPYKYLMLRPAEGNRAAFHALAAAKFLHLAAIGPFGALVFFSSALLGIGGESWHTPFFLLGIASLVFAAGFWVLMLWKGLGRMLLGGYYRIRRRVPRPLRKLRRFFHSDRAAATHIQEAWGRTSAAYGLYIGMWAAAAAEWIMVAMVLGIDWHRVGLTGAGLIECASLIVGAVIPVPAGVGTQEAGKVFIAGVLGLSPQTGLAMSLIRRGREILMVLLGVALAAFEGRRGSIDATRERR